MHCSIYRGKERNLPVFDRRETGQVKSQNGVLLVASLEIKILVDSVILLFQCQ